MHTTQLETTTDTPRGPFETCGITSPALCGAKPDGECGNLNAGIFDDPVVQYPPLLGVITTTSILDRVAYENIAIIAKDH